ncbi:hypothetical protein [Pseudomonas frederiksbergensis]|uniref:hypothetical protein n=1 Tax=Pseudomonas frederiksbergensis TaxID=104087 RepID=UPI00160C2BAD|nr:hypothetical protein [Pseudomonas frederiksbergensis]
MNRILKKTNAGAAIFTAPLMAFSDSAQVQSRFTTSAVESPMLQVAKELSYKFAGSKK